MTPRIRTMQVAASTTRSVIDELRWRGLIHITGDGEELFTPGLDALLVREKVTAYIGFDPSADSLHIGNLLGIMMLVRMQRHGHRPIAIAGGGTGLIGDPGGKSVERPLLTRESLQANLEGIREQLARFLDFDARDSAALLINNADWLEKINSIDFMRDVGKHFSVNYMLAKESVQSRLAGGITYTEFSYMLLQAYDYMTLFDRYGCLLQMGGERPVGQYNRRRRSDTPGAGGPGARPRHSADHQDGRRQVREDRGRCGLARRGQNLAVPVLPVLAEHRRRRRRQVHPVLHASDLGRDRRISGGGGGAAGEA